MSPERRRLTARPPATYLGFAEADAKALPRSLPARPHDHRPAVDPRSRRPGDLTVRSRRVACDGVGGALGHPRVWLEMGDRTSSNAATATAASSFAKTGRTPGPTLRASTRATIDDSEPKPGRQYTGCSGDDDDGCDWGKEAWDRWAPS